MKSVSATMSLAAILCVLAFSLPCHADFPQPSLVPISWDLTVKHGKPTRIVVKSPGDDSPVAYWYITYHVVNNTDRDSVPFFPTFDLMREDGQVTKSDTNIPSAVFDAIKAKEHIKYLLNPEQVGGDLKAGEDQSRDSVAIWKEPDLHMGIFTIYATGFSGETATIKVGDKDVTLRKTLALEYHYTVDEGNPSTGSLEEKDPKWIMR